MASLTRDLPAFLAYYCVLNGLGSGTCYFVPLVCGWEYFPHKKGIVSGVILAGYGFSSFIFAQVSTALVNPEHKNPDVEVPDSDLTFYDSSVADRVPYMLQTLVYIWIGLLAISIVLISRPPPNEVYPGEPDEEDFREENVVTGPESPKSE
jgi:hypothetical protein